MGIMQELEVGEDLPEKRSCYEGVFYNYFSVGMHHAYFLCINLIRTCYLGSEGDLLKSYIINMVVIFWSFFWLLLWYF